MLHISGKIIHMTGKSIRNVKNRIYSLLMHLQKCQLYFLEQHSKSCQMCRTVARVNPFITKLGSVFIVVCAWCSTIWLMWIRRPVMQCCKSQNKEVQTPGCDMCCVYTLNKRQALCSMYAFIANTFIWARLLCSCNHRLF